MSCVLLIVCTSTATMNERMPVDERWEKFDATFFLLPFGLSFLFHLVVGTHRFVVILLLLKLLFLPNDRSFRLGSMRPFSRWVPRTHNYTHLIENERQSIMNDRVFSVGYYSNHDWCVCACARVGCLHVCTCRIVWLRDKLLHRHAQRMLCLPAIVSYCRHSACLCKISHPIHPFSNFFRIFLNDNTKCKERERESEWVYLRNQKPTKIKKQWSDINWTWKAVD